MKQTKKTAKKSTKLSAKSAKQACGGVSVKSSVKAGRQKVLL